MPEENKMNYDEVSAFFQRKLEKELNGDTSQEEYEQEIKTKDYGDFRSQYMPQHLNFYEKLCQFSEKFMPFKPDEKTTIKLKEAISTCHLNTTPTGVYSASLVVPLIIVLSSLVLFFVLPVAVGGQPNVFFVMFSLIAAVALLIPLQKLPYTLANGWRLKASNQMVLAVFYIVTYMRHTSNLELAINFAADHLPPPLSLDLRKVIWDVETQKYDSVKDSLDEYLLNWKDHNLEFVESIHLIQSSLYESSNDRRLNSLDKALTVILNETYEKMLHYAHNLKGPLTTLNMLGVVLPILTLVLLPLVVSFLDNFRWYHLFAMYNIALPALVYLLGMNILSTRPGGSGDIDIAEKNPELKKYRNVIFKFGGKEYMIDPMYFCLSLAAIILFIGFIPIIWYTAGLPDLALVRDGGLLLGHSIVSGAAIDGQIVVAEFLSFQQRDDGTFVGPFGLGALLLSILVPLGIGYSVGFYNKLRTRNILKIKKQAKKLELEFSSALFQLGNRIGDGLPAEIAFGKVATLMEDSASGKFFRIVDTNITSLGMNVQKAIFDKEKGALKYYPSDLIESSMKVLVESSRKGPIVASQALINISEYIKQMHRVDERLKDLLGDVISGMKSQVLFLTPVIAGIVVGITSMITNILSTLSDRIDNLAANASAAGNSSILQLFGLGIPTYQFQIVVGLYVVQLAYILSVIGNGIENGPDKTMERANIGSQLTKSAMTYSGIAFVVILLFNIVASTILTSLN